MKYVIGLVAILMTVVGSAAATIIHVPPDYSTIQGGVDAAQYGDTVMVGAGTFNQIHHPPGADTTQCVVHMKSGVTLLGAGPGQTTIDPENHGRGIYCYGVTNARIEGFTVTRAFAQSYGAGIFCTEGSSPTITNCTITGCGDGGIILTYNSHATISYCLIRANDSKEGGGLAIEYDCSPTVSHCTINRNSAPVAGGVFVRSGCAPVFEHCVIDSNFLSTANGSGGGVAARSAQITLRNCQVNRNTSTGTGGGFDLRDGVTAVIESTYVQHNSTTGGYGPGGGIYCELSDMDLDACTVTGNSAPGGASDGGGIYIFFTNVTTITGCTIVGNGTVAGLGGGITCFWASPTIENTIIAFNAPGQGLYCWDESIPVVSCTDIYGNQHGDALCGTDAGGNFSQDPLFCDRANDNYTLRGTSPCLPGRHPYGAPCGLIGAHTLGCETDVAGPGSPAAGPIMGHFAAPNPSGTSVSIYFAMGQPGRVQLAMYDVSGRRVRLLEDRVFPAGNHRIAWDTRDDEGRVVPSGVYFYRLSGSMPQQTGRLVLSR